jgi:hypothetical protein
MAASVAPAAKQAILTLLTARPALNLVAITWAAPTEAEDLQDELIFFDGPVVRLPEWRVLGGPSPPLDETYTLTLKVRNRVYDDDANAAETRTWALVAEIEQAVRGDLRLGGLIRSLEFGEQEVVNVRVERRVVAAPRRGHPPSRSDLHRPHLSTSTHSTPGGAT